MKHEAWSEKGWFFIDSFVYETASCRVIFGENASRLSLTGELDRLGAQRVLLIASRRDDVLVEDVSRILGHRLAGLFREVRPHVPADIAFRAYQAALAVSADCLLCVGGGSATGMAKAVALKTSLPIVAIPTTYAGSEATPVWGLTEHGRKTTGRAPMVKPKAVIYDPSLTLSLPPSITGPSAINALAHAVEAFYAPMANPVTTLKAQEAARMIGQNLRTAVCEPGQREARANLLYGALLAGEAFAEAGSGIHHKICHVLGGAFTLPHAATHAVVLPQVVAYNQPAIPGSAAKLAHALQCANPAQALFDLARDVGTPTALAQLGMTPDDLKAALDLMSVEAWPDNPRNLDASGLALILTRAYEGRRPE